MRGTREQSLATSQSTQQASTPEDSLPVVQSLKEGFLKDARMGSIAEEPSRKIISVDSEREEKEVTEEKSSSRLKDQSILQAKLTKLAVQIGYAGKIFLL